MSVVNYCRFKPHSLCGLIGTGNCIEFIPHPTQDKKLVAITACELVIIWNVKTKTKVIYYVSYNKCCYRLFSFILSILNCYLLGSYLQM